ncbi:MAG: hypothetical protein LBG76_05210 [Treponema sp.]|jgi:hypothetical protein|nr:hypothetical protein [Treponema sp.]
MKRRKAAKPIPKRTEFWNRLSVFPVIGIVLFASCASSNPYLKVDQEVSRGDYADGISYIDSHKKKLYRNRDAVLFYLDKGMLTHYDRRYDDSIALLQDGERAIEDAFTKSVTMEIGTYLLNDTTREYGGEDYEDIYINAFNALNYYHLDNLEDALVEIRRMNNKLRFLASKYDIITTNLQQKALEEHTDIPYNPESFAFNDSALARYLGILFYRAVGNADDARIDQDRLKLAFANAPDVYPYPVPASVDEELSVPHGMARLNVIGFSGLSPLKEESVIRIPLPYNRWMKIALPVMVSRPSLVRRIEVTAGAAGRFTLELLEDIDAVAQETFKKKAEVIYFKSILRGVIKGTAASVLSAAAEDASGDTGLALWLTSIGAQIVAEASERADLRISRYFPAKAWVGGINLNPGIYAVTVNYYNAQGRLIASSVNEVDVKAGNLNLVEALCTY